MPTVELLEWLKGNWGWALVVFLVWAFATGRFVLRRELARERREKLFWQSRAEAWERNAFEMAKSLNRNAMATEVVAQVVSQKLEARKEDS